MGGSNQLLYRRGSIALFVTILLTVFIFVHKSGARVISNSSNQCADVLLVFARGSSSNPDAKNIEFPFSPDFELGTGNTSEEKARSAEEIPGAFFRWMEMNLKADYPHIDYKAISIHNSAKGWSINGYLAVGIFGASTINNIFDAEWFWWPAGEYRGSVDSGAHELAGQVNYETTRCPNQRIIIGGYSQGAHVVHEALKIIPIEQRNIIDDVVLFGDPKYIGSEYNKYNLLDKPKAYPWSRGTAGLRERGLADAEIPYVPEDMKYKTISWCHEDDFVCTGFSGLSWAISNHELPSNNSSIWMGPENALGDGHKRYPSFGVPEAAKEVVSNLESQLLPLEIARGGFDASNDPAKKSYDGSLKNSRPVDLMFAFNKTGGNDDAFFQYSQNLKPVLEQYKGNFPQMQTGSVMYTDMAGGSGAHQSSVAAYTQAPNQLSTDMSKMFNWSPYIYGGLGGGGDYPENHGMAIERSAQFANWRSNATKHIVLFAERPALDVYSFNQCDSFVLSQLPFSDSDPCAPGSSFSALTHPEMCVSIRSVLIPPASCSFTGQNANQSIISRSLQDVVLLARARGFEVDIIQPHEARDGQQGYEPALVDAQLKSLAESTGGLYLKYGVFDEPALRDAIWQILNHQSLIMDMTSLIPGTYLNPLLPASVDPLNTLGMLSLSSNVPQLVNVSSIVGARSYGWDTNSDGVTDQVSYGPRIELITDGSPCDFITVTAYEGSNGSGPVLSTLVLPVVAAPSTEVAMYEDGVQTSGLTGLVAVRDGGVVNIHWQTQGLSEHDFVVIRDPESGIVIKTVPVMSGVIQIGGLSEDIITLSVQLVSNGAEADPQLVEIVVPSTDTNLGEDSNDPIQDPTSPQEPSDIPDSSSPETPIVVVEVSSPLNLHVSINTGSVGQTDDKVVAQDEPNSTQDPNSPAIKKSEPTSTATQTPSTYYSPPETTFVEGAQDVKTNPQGEVGGIEAANELFKGEEIGKQNEPIENKQVNWLLILAIGAGAVMSTVLGILILGKKKLKEDEK